MSRQPRKNLIFGAAVGYREHQIAPFLYSLARTGYRGDVALLVDAELAKRLRNSDLGRGLILLVARQWLPFRLQLFKGRRKRLLKLWDPVRTALWLLLRLVGGLPLPSAWRRRWQAAIVSVLHPPHQTRFLYYQRFIQSSGHTHILLTDVRDVFFQADPFAELPQEGLAVSVEPRQYTLASEPHNARWIRLAYGQAMLDEIGDRPVSCSGVTYGDRESVLQYLEQMRRAIIGLRFRATDRPLDQAPHNVLLWTGKLGDCRLLDTFESAVATLNGITEADLRFDGQGRLTNRDGSPISVLHMYDRWPGLGPRLLATIDTT